MIFGMSIRQFLQIRDLGGWELQPSNSSLVDVNSLFPLAVCFTPSLKNYCLFNVVYSLIPVPEVTSFAPKCWRGTCASSPFTSQCIRLGCWREQVHWRFCMKMAERLLNNGGAGWQLVFSCPSMVCQRHLSVPSVLCYQGGNFLPACSGELQCSTPVCVLVWNYFRGFSFILFDNGQGALEQSGLNAC